MDALLLAFRRHLVTDLCDFKSTLFFLLKPQLKLDLQSIRHLYAIYIFVCIYIYIILCRSKLENFVFMFVFA